MTDMSSIFRGAASFDGDISKWDVSGVTYMRNMLSNMKFHGDISQWDVSRVTSMSGMFWFATSFNSDISKWDVSRVTVMNRMFMGASPFNSDISKWAGRFKREACVWHVLVHLIVQRKYF